MLIPGQTQEDGEAAPGSVKPLRRADVHVIEPMGSEVWIDVRIHTAHVDHPVGRDLLREKHQKCRAYGQHGYDVKQTGARDDSSGLGAASMAEPPQGRRLSFSDYYRTQALVRQGLAADSAAKRQASSELWAPLSCILLRGMRLGRPPTRSTHGPGPTLSRCPPQGRHLPDGRARCSVG